ncbi:hypothetical protein [Mongoliibacter ruber]|nr:hypothetical protein [Mongoliibacter ruber]
MNIGEFSPPRVPENRAKKNGKTTYLVSYIKFACQNAGLKS